MDSDATKPPPRAGATNAAAPPPAAGIERLLRRKNKPLPVGLFLTAAEWVHTERRRLRLTQLAMARKHGIPERQIATYEAAAKWPPEAKAFLKANPERFCLSDVTRLFANRSWRSKETLLSALARHAAGKPPRKRRSVRKDAAKDPNLLSLQDRLRAHLQTRVEVIGDGRTGEMRISFFSVDELERLLGILGA
jgi:hypothetical protein